MFTPKNIQGALEELYDLCDPDYMVDMLVNYSEEFDDISPALLAKSFQKNAEMISEYRVLSSAGEGIDYQGKVLLNSRAVRLLSYVEDMSGDEKVRTIQSKELWLLKHQMMDVLSLLLIHTIPSFAKSHQKISCHAINSRQLIYLNWWLSPCSIIVLHTDRHNLTCSGAASFNMLANSTEMLTSG